MHATVKVAPYAVIEGDVELGAHCEIGTHAHIKGPAIFGTHNQIYSFCSLGDVPQDLKYEYKNPGRLQIGNHNVLREGCAIHHSAIARETVLGNHNYLMIYSHVGHDCRLGDHNVVCNNAGLGGHVEIGDYVGLSAQVLVHPFCRIGSHAYIGRAGVVVQDITPYTLSTGSGSRTHGINAIGLRRRGFQKETIHAIRQAHNLFHRRDLNKEEAIAQLEPLAAEFNEVKFFIDFLKAGTQRGIAR